MVVHIVMLKLKDENKQVNIQKIKNELDSLPQKISVLKSIEVGVDFMQSTRSFDLSLYAIFDTKEDLAIYDTHPEHLKVVSFIKEVAIESKAVDYMLDK